MGIIPVVVLCLVVANIGKVAGFSEAWNNPTSDSFVMYTNPNQGSVDSGTLDQEAIDGRSLKISLKPNPPHGVGGAPAAETLARYQYGSYWSRVKTANCSAQPNAGVVTGIFTFFNDGSDSNGNGLPDNNELDFEWLCASPEILHLTIWTDYAETDPPQLRSVYRSINLRTGEVLVECYRESFAECLPLDNSENQPSSLTPIPNYDSSTQYYEYGIVYEANRLRFLMKVGSETRTLWDYQGPSNRIPKQAMHYMHNVWHSNNWYPVGKPEAVESPTSPVNVFVDHSSFDSL